MTKTKSIRSQSKISYLVHTARFWNNLYVQNQMIGKPNNLKVLRS